MSDKLLLSLLGIVILSSLVGARNLASISPDVEQAYNIVRISGNESCWATTIQSGTYRENLDIIIKPASERVCIVCDKNDVCTAVRFDAPITLNVYDENKESRFTLLAVKGKFTFNELSTANSRSSLRFLRFGEQTIIIAGSSTYNSTDVNVTQENKYAHMNITVTPPYNSLKAYWNFDMDLASGAALLALDTTNNNVDGTYDTEAPTGNTCGIPSTQAQKSFIGCSYTYNGTTGVFAEGINFGATQSNLYLGAGNLTITAWVKKGVEGNVETVIKRGLGTSAVVNNQQYLLQATANGGFRFVMGNGSSSNTVTSDANSTFIGNWTHVAATVNESGAMNLYVNGILNATTQRTITNIYRASGSNQTNIGTVSSLSEAAIWRGQLDEIMVFNTSLNSSQILDIYNNKSSRFNPKGTMLFTNLNLEGNNSVTIRLNNTTPPIHYPLDINYFTVQLATTLKDSYLSMFMNNGTEVNFTNGLVSNYIVQGNLTSANLTIIFHPGNSSDNPFYTPYLMGNITIDSELFVTGSSISMVLPNTNYDVPFCKVGQVYRFDEVPFGMIGQNLVFP